MAKGRRKRVGDFEVGDSVFVGKTPGVIESFISRRVAVLMLPSGKKREVSTLDLRKEKQ